MTSFRGPAAAAAAHAGRKAAAPPGRPRLRPGDPAPGPQTPALAVQHDPRRPRAYSLPMARGGGRGTGGRRRPKACRVNHGRPGPADLRGPRGLPSPSPTRPRTPAGGPAQRAAPFPEASRTFRKNPPQPPARPRACACALEAVRLLLGAAPRAPTTQGACVPSAPTPAAVRLRGPERSGGLGAFRGYRSRRYLPARAVFCALLASRPGPATLARLGSA
uniref:Uncharacterized protein n=1 Tax=Rangifer tarandus platyrhynchus TaxID=3082113 RepID=A0ACB0E6G0_RANTA|nr:unnamed protein product [Rangifer tarandus platyrhynchus]